MLPYYDEYFEKFSNTDLSVYCFRLRELNRIDKDVLKMPAEDIADAINAKEMKISTLNGFYSSFQHYLKWIYEKHNIPISDCFYELKRLRDLASDQCVENLKATLFTSFSELKKVLLQTEEENLLTQELEISEVAYDSLCNDVKKFNAYVVFMWNCMPTEKILEVSISEVGNIIESKQILVGSKNVNISDDEVELLKDAYEMALSLQDDDAKNKQGSRRKRKKWLYDNLFNTKSVRSLTNLNWKALGSNPDIRLEKTSIKKAGIFNRMYRYEKENDYIFSGVEGFDTCSKLLEVSLSKAQRLVNEYTKFRKSIEKTEDI